MVITQEEVNAVADQLRACGAKPHCAGREGGIGGGSMATVLKRLQAGRADRSGHQKPGSAASGPAARPGGLHRTGGCLGQVTLEADLVTAQQANQDLIAESERLAVALQREQSTVETLQADKAELSGRLGQLTKDLEEVRAGLPAWPRGRRACPGRRRPSSISWRVSLAWKQGGSRRRFLKWDITPGCRRAAGSPCPRPGWTKTEPSSRAGCQQCRAPPGRRAGQRLRRSVLDQERAARVSAEQQAAVALAKLEKTEAQATDLAARLAKAEAWLEEARGKAPLKP